MPPSTTRIWLAVALGCLLPVALAPLAQAADGDKPATIRLEPKRQPGIDRGKAVVVKGEAGKVPQRFLLDGITYMMPVAVALRPVEAGQEVSMNVTKYAWNQPLRQGSSDGDVLRYLFRTEGEFQVSVTSEREGTPYRLLVWVGDETKPDLAPVVVRASEFEGDAGGTTWWIWLVAGAGLVVAAVLAVRWSGKRKTP